MSRPAADCVRLDTLALQLFAGDRVHLIEIARENDSFLIRIPDYNIVDLLPLSHQAASRLLDRLPPTTVDRDTWTNFLTDPSSLEHVLGLAEQRVAASA
jgi:hypothetical protein